MLQSTKKSLSFQFNPLRPAWKYRNDTENLLRPKFSDPYKANLSFLYSVWSDKESHKEWWMFLQMLSRPLLSGESNGKEPGGSCPCVQNRSTIRLKIYFFKNYYRQDYKSNLNYCMAIELVLNNFVTNVIIYSFNKETENNVPTYCR